MDNKTLDVIKSIEERLEAQERINDRIISLLERLGEINNIQAGINERSEKAISAILKHSCYTF